MTETTVERAPITGEDFGGTWTQLGGKQYKLAPLNFKSLRGGLAEKLTQLQNLRSRAMPSGEDFGMMCEVVLASLQRNYPDLDLAFIEERMDLTNFNPILSAVLQVTALPLKEGDPPVGETAP